MFCHKILKKLSLAFGLKLNNKENFTKFTGKAAILQTTEKYLFRKVSV